MWNFRKDKEYYETSTKFVHRCVSLTKVNKVEVNEKYQKIKNIGKSLNFSESFNTLKKFTKGFKIVLSFFFSLSLSLSLSLSHSHIKSYIVTHSHT